MRWRGYSTPGCPGHDIFRRDFRGACGLFAVVLTGLEEAGLEAVDDLVANLDAAFARGYRWGSPQRPVP